MSTQLVTREHLVYYDYAKRNGIFVHFDPHNLKNGVIILNCGDGHRAPEAISYKWGLCDQHGFERRTHFVTLNGGPLLLAVNSPLRDRETRDDLTMIHHTLKAYELKRFPLILYLPHIPCSAAIAAGITHPMQIIRMTLQAKARLGQILEEKRIPAKILCAIHIDYTGKLKDMRTRVISEEAWHHSLRDHRNPASSKTAVSGSVDETALQAVL